MNILFILLIISMIPGQLGAIVIRSGTVMYIHDVFLILFVAFGLNFIRTHKIRIIRPNLMIPITGFILTGGISLMLNSRQFSWLIIFYSSLYLIRWILYALMYVILIQKIIPKLLLVYGVFIYGIVLAVLGFVQLALYPDLRNLSYLGWDPHYYRLFSTLLDPNFTGMILVLTFFTGIYIWNTYHPTKKFILLLVLSAVAIYATYSRSSYLALGAGILAASVYVKRWIILGMFVIFSLIVIAVPTPGGNTLRLDRADSTFARFDNWKQSWSIVQTSPIIGLGFNTLPYVRKPWSTDKPDTSLSRASSGIDSSVLFILATTGFTGLLMYLWMLKRIAVTVVNKKKSDKSGPLIIGVCVSLCVHSLFSNSLFYSWVMMYTWILVAAAEITSDT